MHSAENDWLSVGKGRAVVIEDDEIFVRGVFAEFCKDEEVADGFFVCKDATGEALEAVEVADNPLVL